ncbi:hypothetical protein LCGC14_0629460 [marine sediment metagenome]|uniref:Uncharacterized protein n=1 Tax=marine sediment metagenome TaxID=412755 RepID=A0A0F9TNY8_9ZZZZ
MNDYFKPSYLRWFYKPSTFWKNVCSTFLWVRHCWQRAFRGYADCDCWSIASYLTEIMPPMLKQFKTDLHGCPGWGEAATQEKWDYLIDRMIEGFEAAKRVEKDEYYMGTNADILTRKPSSEEVKSWIELSEADLKIFEDNMKPFVKWFFHLWD